LNYANTAARIEGSQLWAAQLEDERYLPEIARRLKEQREASRPALLGYTRLVAAIDSLTDHVYMLRAEQGHWPAVSLRVKPRYPADVLAERKRVMNQTKTDEFLAYAHSLKGAS
jgi:hypothetical protein